MHKYLIQFSKTGYIRFTSHLDMVRLFQRSMKRAGISLAYSQGFHPHPRMSIVQPLSLGFTSEGEYVEIATDKAYNTDELQKKLSAAVPEGIGIRFVKALPDGIKSPASLIEYAAYEIYFIAGFTESECGKGETEDASVMQKKTQMFLSQQNILMEKLQKKTGKTITVDIKAAIYKNSIQIEKMKEWTSIGGKISDIGVKPCEGCYKLEVMLKTGSTANLNPELLLKSYFAFTKIVPSDGRLLIHRKDMYFIRNGKPVSLTAIAGSQSQKLI